MADPEIISEGMRERKKRLLRQLISDTATQLVLERGFENVKVSEIAAACDVSEKTIFNYFPTKESMILDREEDMAARIRTALGPEATKPPLDSLVDAIYGEIDYLYRRWQEFDDPDVSLVFMRRFNQVMEETPSLRAASMLLNERLGQVAAKAMGERLGISDKEIEIQVAGRVLANLFSGYWDSSTLSNEDDTIEDLRDRMKQNVERAAALLNSGFWTLGVDSKMRGKFAVRESVVRDARKVITAISKARKGEPVTFKNPREEQREWMREMMTAHRDDMKAYREQMRRDRTTLREEIKKRRG